MGERQVGGWAGSGWAASGISQQDNGEAAKVLLAAARGSWPAAFCIGWEWEGRGLGTVQCCCCPPLRPMYPVVPAMG